MAGLCKVTIIGHLGRDPETRYTQNGDAVTTFSVAVSRTYTSGGERKEETEWFRVSAFRRLGEVANQYLHKGSKVYLEGRLSTRAWETPDGRKGTSLEVTATDLQMLDSRPREGAEPAEEHGMSEAGGQDLDTIPF